MNNKYYFSNGAFSVRSVLSVVWCAKNTHNYSVNQGDIRFTGTVIDEAGIPVIGANILVKGTTNGTITDMDGRFTLINVPENAILVVSYIGYLDREIPVAGKVRWKSV